MKIKRFLKVPRQSLKPCVEGEDVLFRRRKKGRVFCSAGGRKVECSVPPAEEGKSGLSKPQNMNGKRKRSPPGNYQSGKQKQQQA